MNFIRTILTLCFTAALAVHAPTLAKNVPTKKLPPQMGIFRLFDGGVGVVYCLSDFKYDNMCKIDGKPMAPLQVVNKLGFSRVSFIEPFAVDGYKYLAITAHGFDVETYSSHRKMK